MAPLRDPEDLSIAELRRLLVEKQRAARQGRVERFRRSGRVIRLASDTPAPSLEGWRAAEEVTPAPPRRRGLDLFLQAVEVAAVIGLIFILVNGLSVIQQLNREVVASIAQPTLTPTPLIVAVVLPSGHTPPNAPGGARFNEAEIPSHLRPLVQSLADVRQPTAAPGQAVRIQAPTIKVDAPIVQGDSWEQLKKGVGQHATSVSPGEAGNLILSAHNDIFGEIFRDLDRLKPGDEIVIFTQSKTFTYRVVDTEIVPPTRTEVLAQTTDPTLTLISCYPYLIDDQRIVVVARLLTDAS
jgi:sortase A